VIPLLLAWLCRADAGTLAEEEAALWAHPLDPIALRAYAERLAATPGHEEEAVEALKHFIADPNEDLAVREALYGLLKSRAPRRGWDAAYAALAVGPSGPPRDLGRVRSAQLRLTSPASRPRGIAALQTIAGAHPTDPIAQLALGDALLAWGSASAARVAYERAGGAAGDRGAALAALAEDRPVDAGRLRARALAGGATHEQGLGDAFTAAVLSPTPLARAKALAAAGFGSTAEDVLGFPPGARDDAPGGSALDPDEAELLATLRMARGDAKGAVIAWRVVLAAHPSPAARVGLVRALVAAGRLDEAAAALPPADAASPKADRAAAGDGAASGGGAARGFGPPLEPAQWTGEPTTVSPISALDRAALEADIAFARALATKSPTDDSAAAALAWEKAPDEPGVAATWGRLLLVAGQDDAAVAPLTHAVMLAPDDPVPRGQLVGLALRRGEVGHALDLAAAGLAPTDDPHDHAAAMDTLASLLVMSAEAQKQAGAPAAARSSLLLALAVRPQSAAVLRGIGGLLWQEGSPETALAVYRHAAALDPADPDAPLAAARLCVQLGRRAEAKAILDALPRDSKAVHLLREDLARDTKAAAARALAETDPDASIAAWKVLIAAWPGDARFLHGLADVYLKVGRFDEALAIQRAALTLEPKDSWNRLGVATSLLGLGRSREAAEALDGLPTDVPAEVARERDRLRARLAREAGDRARAAGDDDSAWRHYQEAFVLDPDAWTTVALAGALTGRGDPAGGYALYEQAQATANGDADIDVVAARGEAGALEAMGRSGDALALLDALAERHPDPATDELRDALRSRMAVAAADELRRAGRLAEAEAALRDLAIENGGEPLVQTAWAAVLLERGRAREAVAAVTRALMRDPTNSWALQVARDAGRACGCSEKVVPLYRVAVAAGAGPEVRAWLGRIQVAAEAEAGLARAAAHHRGQARRRLVTATRMAGEDPESLLIVAESEQEFRRPRKAIAALDHALAVDPDHIPALLLRAQILEAHGWWREAIASLDARWQIAPDQRIGGLLARYRIEHLPKPGYPVLWSPGAPTPAPVVSPPHSAPARPGPTGPIATAGFGFLRRDGVAGVGQELLTYVPVHLGPPALGPVRLDLEAVILRVEDGLRAEYGVAPSVGASTPLERPWAAWGRIGTSPLGFATPAYPVWYLAGRGRIGLPLVLGVETGRAPVLDSLPSWAGGMDPFTGAPYARVAHTWFGGWAGLGAPWGTDLGVLGRIGESTGIGLDPLGRAEVVAWIGQRIGTPERSVRIGAEADAFSFERRAEGFELGQGAFYSPPIFAVATGRLDLRWHDRHDRFGLCAGGGAGYQYAGGGASLYFAPGTQFTYNGRLTTSLRVAGAWGVALEGSLLVAGPWHQETGLLRFGRVLDGPPPITTISTPAIGLTWQGEPC
jgi:tetratricopeptide (TPR) repeat protein